MGTLKADTIEDADAAEVCRLLAEGRRVTDPELIARIRRRADAVREEIRREHGVVEWAVDLIRDARDEWGTSWTPPSG